MSNLNPIDLYVSFHISLTAMKEGDWDANRIINQLFLSKPSSIEGIALDRGYHNFIYQMQMLRWDEAPQTRLAFLRNLANLSGL